MPVKPSKVLVVTDDDSLFRLFSLLLKDTEFFFIRPAESRSIVKEILHSDPALVLLDVDRAPGTRLIDLCRILVESPRPVLVVTRDSDSSRQAVAKSLNLGAVDVLNLPVAASDLTPTQRQRLLRVMTTSASMRIPPLAFKDIAAALESVSRRKDEGENISELFQSHLEKTRNFDIVGLAISTGGPNALSQFVPSLPAAFPVPILVVQHIIPGFIGGIVKRLNDSCEVRVKMAEQGERLELGTVYFGPDKLHLMVEKSDGVLRVRLSSEPSQLLFCPSADVLFGSIAESCAGRSLGVIMTGMGHDGVEGLRLIKNSGGVTVAQDRHSSTIYGMARVADDANIIDHVVPLNRMAAEVYRLLFEEKPDYSENRTISS
jgi:two-component system, chemotaxis family, protein-glutamate methylesterase/glutaminase